jgi:hypothetical protein
MYYYFNMFWAKTSSWGSTRILVQPDDSELFKIYVWNMYVFELEF